MKIERFNMQLTIDIKDSAIDKVMYLLNHLKSDVKIIYSKNENVLDIQTISKDDEDYTYISNSRNNRQINPSDYVTLDDIKWN